MAGATGAQGGGLVRSILADPDGEFAVRAITRDPDSPKARALAAAGAEVVAADIADKAAVARAFDGAYGAYCVTFFWNHFSPDQERAEAHALADAAKQAGVQHVVWSTLEDSRRFVKLDDPRMPTLMGKLQGAALRREGRSGRLLPRDGRADHVPADVVLLGQPDPLRHGPQDRSRRQAVLRTADGRPGRCPASRPTTSVVVRTGSSSAATSSLGRTVGIAGEHLTGAQMAAGLTRALGREVLHQDVPFDVYRGLGFPGAEDLGNMFQFNHDFSADFCRARSVEFTRSINPQLQSFADWLAVHGREIPLT